MISLNEKDQMVFEVRPLIDVQGKAEEIGRGVFLVTKDELTDPPDDTYEFIYAINSNYLQLIGELAVGEASIINSDRDHPLDKSILTRIR